MVMLSWVETEADGGVVCRCGLVRQAIQSMEVTLHLGYVVAVLGHSMALEGL